MNNIDVNGVVGVRGQINEVAEGHGGQTENAANFLWHDDEVAQLNYEALGRRLAQSGDLFRRPQLGSGLIQLLSSGKHRIITRGSDLYPVLVDRLKVSVMKEGKIKGSRINGSDLNAMLKSEVFLNRFVPVDRITSVPVYLPEFRLTVPGFNDGGIDHRILLVGEEAPISNELEAINTFLEVMAFATNADRTNAVAAALTVLLHNHWPGGKPIVLVTATKSHSGKDTVISFACGAHKLVAISYQSTDWAVERCLVGAIKNNPDVAVVVVENARMGREKVIASAIIERIATDPEPLLFSTGTGAPVRIRNELVLAISTNFGSVSEDIMNRALPIHLNPTGNVADRRSPIGNPKLEFLPANQAKIAAELRGMIERWKEAGQPLDDDVRHPFGPWAKTVGGILKVSGFTEFLANYGNRRTADDPIRRGLSILGSSYPDTWLTPREWARNVIDLGLEKAVIPVADQGTDAGRQRGVGVVLTNYQDETLLVETEAGNLTLLLKKDRRRWDGNEPHVKYQFQTINSLEVE